jgi:thiamine kinase-like enzyme
MTSISKRLGDHPLFQDDPIERFELLPQQGYCNTHYIIETRKHKYVLRAFGRNDIDRRSEYRLQSLAAKRKITAKPYLLDIESGYMLTQLLTGVHKRTLSRRDLHKLAVVLAKLHKIRFRMRRFTPKQISSKKREIRKAVSFIERTSCEWVVCHNDLNPLNIFCAQNMKLIDWEYASLNDRYFDLASVCVEFGLKRKEVRYFLQRYFRHGKKADYKKLEAYKVVYRTLCEEWFGANLKRSVAATGTVVPVVSEV